MSKIHVILVVFFVCIIFILNGVNFESNLCANINIPISIFGYFIKHKLNIHKRRKIKKLIEEIFIKLILNIMNFV